MPRDRSAPSALLTLAAVAGVLSALCGSAHADDLFGHASDLRAVPQSNAFCLACHSNPAMVSTRAEAMSLFVDGAAYASSKHGAAKILCTGCHPTMGTVPHVITGSVRRMVRSVVTEQCVGCHAAVASAYVRDAHGAAFVPGMDLDAAACTDCHGVHAMMSPKDPAFRVAVFDACVRCHSDADRMGRAGLSTTSVTSYEAEFHGLSVSLRRSDTHTPVRWAVCPDCHAGHLIRKPGAPDSPLARGNRITVCRKCHEHVSDSFAFASSGHLQSIVPSTPSYYANLFYLVAIPAGIVTMVVYMVLETFRFALIRRRRGRPT